MAEQPTAPTTDGDSLPGFLFALGAYLLWGFLPLYMKALAHIPATEVIAHRVLWSVPIAGLVLIATRRTADLRRALATPRMIAMAAITAGIISLNWGIYVWAIGAGHALDAALGYYINPIFSIFLGAVLLRERLMRAQWMAIALAVLAVVILTVEAGRLPLISLALTLSWGGYAFFKKMLPIGPNQGFMLEVLLLTPLALGYVLWLGHEGTGHFLAGSAFDTWMLLGCGAVTAIPLILYANGAKRLTLSTIAIMQYIAPTMIFLAAVFVFGEEFDRIRAITFALIWAALVMYTAALLSRGRRSAA